MSGLKGCGDAVSGVRQLISGNGITQTVLIVFCSLVLICRATSDLFQPCLSTYVCPQRVRYLETICHIPNTLEWKPNSNLEAIQVYELSLYQIQTFSSVYLQTFSVYVLSFV
jgi:hypothetical protein